MEGEGEGEAATAHSACATLGGVHEGKPPAQIRAVRLVVTVDLLGGGWLCPADPFSFARGGPRRSSRIVTECHGPQTLRLLPGFPAPFTPYASPLALRIKVNGAPLS